MYRDEKQEKHFYCCLVSGLNIYLYMYIYIDKFNKDQEIFICIDIYSLLFKLLKLENANF